MLTAATMSGSISKLLLTFSAYKTLPLSLSHFHLLILHSVSLRSSLSAAHTHTLRTHMNTQTPKTLFSCPLSKQSNLFSCITQHTHLPFSHPCSCSLCAISSLSYTASYVYLHNQIAQKNIMKRESYASFMESSLAFVLFPYLGLSSTSSPWSAHFFHLTHSVFFSSSFLTHPAHWSCHLIQSQDNVLRFGHYPEQFFHRQSETVPVRCFAFSWKYLVWFKCAWGRRETSSIHTQLSQCEFSR